MPDLLKTVTSAASLKTPEQHHRAHAVAAALEVIAGYAASGSPSVNLSYELEQLSTYADQIQAALKAE
ncbi:hypothetical protein BTW15_01285 [Pseudomonas syringae pv. tomato]|uniref:DUF3077 domain-containing protein n=1 Tax=Pseudomonas syringae pv. tomato TaxID=323 RepID=A0AB36L3E7_PSEUB|nr:hypothetical protein [Pseudomonas syringae group genomosp. 3]MBX6510477.1 hypothetical protein [Pseudomonas syringae pv. tomato]OPE62010.1 hypothetical protein BTW15_01285 [Pseudomonas syringae pv. tomato]TES74657.1 hypothetical protein E2N89_23615 [Pseudomonas syringae pv. tomato]